MRATSILCVAAVALTVLPLTALATNDEEIWQVEDGRVTFNFYSDALERYGIRLVDIAVMPNDPAHPVPPINDPEWCVGGFRAGKLGQLDLTLLDVSQEPRGYSFDITESSDLRFRVKDGIFVPYGFEGGSIRVEGGLDFVTGPTDLRWTMRDFRLAYLDNPNDGPGGAPDPDLFGIRDDSANAPAIADIGNTMVAFLPMYSMLILGHNDVYISEEWAAAAGRPELAGRLLGAAQVYAIARPVGPASPVEHLPAPQFYAGGTDVLDVALGFLENILEAGREGTYPNGISGLSMATTSCNKGNVDVPWEAPMAENHPGIPMQLYREKSAGAYTTFEMIGQSDMKHGFFALSSSQCDPCQHPSDGSFLGVGCSDTYGTGNNADRNWLAPRDEWNPYVGTWECTGSHFAGGLPDCVRRHGSAGHDDVEHRLQVADSELGDASSTYYYEAMYVVPGEMFKMDNCGSRRCTMTWDGFGWNFVTPSSNNALVEGPAILRWEHDLATWTQIGTDDGYVILAAKSTPLGGGLYHYEYALYNWDSDRRIRSISIPIDSASQITNVGFHDADYDPANDWQAIQENGDLVFSTSTFAEDPDANAVMFQWLFNFRFDADAPPNQVDATLGVFKPGDPDQVFAETMAPGTVTAVEDPLLTGEVVRFHPSRPNPIRPTTTLRFDLGEPTHVQLEIFSADGRRIRVLVDEPMEAGSHDVAWDGMATDGTKVGPGVYYCLLRAGQQTATQSLVVTQ